MQAYPSRGHREHYYSVVEEEEVVEEDHMRYKDNYHHYNNNGPNMHMKPNNQWYPKHEKIHKNGGYGGHDEHKYGRENYEDSSETYYEGEEYRESRTEKNGFSGHNEGNNNHRMNKYGAPYGSGVHGGGYGAHHGNRVEHRRPSYGGYECDEKRNGQSIWNFKGIVDE